MNKKFIKMNDNNNHLSLGNFCRIIKENSLNKSFSSQSEIFSAIFNIDTVNDSTVNNYCIGSRTIGSDYKEIIYNFKDKYKKNKLYMLDIVLDLISIIDGYVYTEEYKNLNFINNNNNLHNVCNKLYNISKNDSSINNEFTNKLYSYLSNYNLYECITEIIFYIILEKKQPIYIDDIVQETIENILNNTSISINDLETFLNLQFNDGTNYSYSIKKLAEKNNPYACFELGIMEYNGEITGTPRYNKSYEYFKIAAEHNHPRANYLIAKMLLEGYISNDKKKDNELAWDYLKKAEKLGSVAALNTIGLLYLKENNIDSAIEYFNKAIKYNYVYSYNNLGKIYENKKDYKKAFNYYIKSADLEESWACNKVGECYRLGIGTNIDLKKAYYYYNLALNVPIKLINNWSQYNLAKYFYLNGNYEANVEKDETKAINLLEVAARSNLFEANFELIIYYANKYILTKNNSYLAYVYTYIEKISSHPKYDIHTKKRIENIFNEIKNKEIANIEILKKKNEL